MEEALPKLITESPISIQGSRVAADIELFIDNQLRNNRKLKELSKDLKLETKEALVKGANVM
jgi:hypothetical protein